MAQRLKCLPGMRETRVQSRGQEDPWSRKWQPTPVLLPGESHGGRSLVGYSPWGRKESDTTERLHFHFHFRFQGWGVTEVQVVTIDLESKVSSFVVRCFGSKAFS